MAKTREFDIINDQVMVICDRVFPLYVIKGEKNFLVDSGVTVKGHEYYTKIKHILDEIEDARTTDIQTLLLTHTHYDHMGSSSFLQKKFGFDVICSHHGAALLQNNRIVTHIDRLNQDYRKMVRSRSEISFEKLADLRVVAKGEKIPVDGCAYFEVLETPGHTKCSVSYFLHPWGILFPGDSTGVMVENGRIIPIFLSSYTEYERSLVNMLSLDIRVLALPHNRFIKGKAKIMHHLEISLQRTREYRDEILTWLEKEADIAKIVEALFVREFPRATLLGTRKALFISLEAMIKVVQKECM